ncbi:MAG: exodeoxyribonuclease V subunit gamma, partial [Lachnospiraceae bacterium]|nr:exodeoxyribonuclease V subunit gamma [Lachnospiraceae bacterium]
MNLQIIAGPSGAGKSTYIYRRIVDEAQQNPKKHYLILVPLQYSMQTQRILVFLHPRRSIMNIDVLSFERLAYRVFDELGTKKTQCLDETGKVLLLRHAAALIQDDLGILRRNIGRRGYIDEVKSLISELMQYGYTPDDVADMASGDLPSTFREKAEDIEKLYREFLALLDESMFTQEQVLSLLCEVADRSELLRDSVIVLDGYTGFTPVQKELLGRIFPLVDTVYACITCDPDTDLYNEGSEEGLFHMSREESSFLISLAGEHLCDPVIIDRGQGRFTDSAEMAFLEEHIFREDGSTMSLSGGVKENGLCDTAVNLIRTRNVNTELLYTAEKIHELVRTEKGLHYRDIAVVCPDVEAYRYSIERVYAASGIPVFLDERKQTQFNPLTELVDAALDMVKRRLSYEIVMRFLRSGLTPLTVDETDILDDYLYEAAFRNTTYLSKPFVRHTQDFHREEDLEKVEAIRVKLAEPLMRFYDAEKSKTATVTQRLTALFGLLTDFDVERKLHERASSKEEAGDMVSADLYRRMYGFLCDLSDQMVSLLGDERMNVSDFRDPEKFFRIPCNQQ